MSEAVAEDEDEEKFVREGRAKFGWCLPNMSGARIKHEACRRTIGRLTCGCTDPGCLCSAQNVVG